MELKGNERGGSVVRYASENGKLYSADFFANGKRYAYADFSAGLPFVRRVDTDGDGYFETFEEYDVIPAGGEGFSSVETAHFRAWCSYFRPVSETSSD